MVLSSGSSQENDRYVIYNYQEAVWYYGQLSRTCWLDTGVSSYPQATANNYLYQHEVGFNDDGSEMQMYLLNQQTWIYKMAKTFLF